ncbi:MAG: hypothetical protein ACXWD8_02370 [Mycobacterium sp.]
MPSEYIHEIGVVIALDQVAFLAMTMFSNMCRRRAALTYWR